MEKVLLPRDLELWTADGELDICAPTELNLELPTDVADDGELEINAATKSNLELSTDDADNGELEINV